MHMYRSTLVALAAALAFAAPALAQTPEVKQEFAKVEEVKTVVWKVDASIGTMFAYGNSNVFNLSGSLAASRRDLKNRRDSNIIFTQYPFVTDCVRYTLVGTFDLTLYT